MSSNIKFIHQSELILLLEHQQPVILLQDSVGLLISNRNELLRQRYRLYKFSAWTLGFLMLTEADVLLCSSTPDHQKLSCQKAILHLINFLLLGLHKPRLRRCRMISPWEFFKPSRTQEEAGKFLPVSTEGSLRQSTEFRPQQDTTAMVKGHHR